MKQSSLENRVAMIQNIREISANNERTMSNIHGIVNNASPKENEKQGVKSKLLYRAVIAVLLFGLYVFASSNKTQYFGIDSSDIDSMISQNLDYQEVFKQLNIPFTQIEE